MSLREVVEKAAFDDATTDTERERVYVPAQDLGIQGASPDDQIVDQLRAQEEWQRIRLTGPSGAGKTSLILRAIRRVSEEPELPVEVLVLRVGDSPELLADKSSVFKYVLDTVKANDHLFSNLDEDLLDDATAQTRTKTPRTVDHQAGGEFFVRYQATIKSAFETAQFGQNAASLRNDLVDVLTAVREEKYRPMLVIDDTEKFVQPGANGAVDSESVRNLFDHGVRGLAEMEADLIVASHPKFEVVDVVGEVTERAGFTELEVPLLPPDLTPPVMSKIFARRLEHAGIETGLSQVIEEAALDALQTLYHERQQDLRSVLKLAHNIAQRVHSDTRTIIEATDIRAELARSSG